jgi:hypothetical protein
LHQHKLSYKKLKAVLHKFATEKQAEMIERYEAMKPYYS